ncbi:chitinase-like protein PB1E7.04c [Macadamia integrifolia]|uniref:chitinase-like protein PB1E7.04c n=1 Tax=Macadamia integrifolia TaxID=60698 RepID=UPI001C4E90E9|nr:chitinase-like protein PB1E7.04c [Macadamia integrifolia]
MSRSRWRKCHRRNRVSSDSFTLGGFHLSNDVCTFPPIGSSSPSSTVVPSASENPRSGSFAFGSHCQLFSSSLQFGSIPASPSTGSTFSIAKPTVNASTSCLSQNPPSFFSSTFSPSTVTVTTVPSFSFGSKFPSSTTSPIPSASSSAETNANGSSQSLGSCASDVLAAAPIFTASAASDFQPTLMPEEKLKQNVEEEGKRGTEPGPVSCQTAIPINGSAVPHFDSPIPVETLGEEVKEMQNSAAEDSCVSELSTEFNLLTNGSRILRNIPQSPHFSSLQAYSDRVRKNLISGWDQTFEETYDQIQSLKATDFWDSKDEQQLTLDELQSMGYNVSLLRKRLDELTNVMEKRESALFAMWSLRTKMESHKREKQKLESKIYKLQMQAEKEQASINGLMDEEAKLEESLPVVDSLFASLAELPL